MQSSKIYYKNGKVYPYLEDEVKYKEPDDGVFYIGNYEQYRREIKHIKVMAENKLSFYNSVEGLKFSILETFIMLNSKDKQHIQYGLCSANYSKNIYGNYDNARLKCPLMRKHIQEMNQEQLDKFIDLQHLSGCNNDKMCEIYSTMPNGYGPIIQKIHSEYEHEFVKKLLDRLSNYLLKS